METSRTSNLKNIISRY